MNVFLFIIKNTTMKLSKIIISGIIILSIGLLASCGNEGVKKDEKPIDLQELSKDQPETHGTEVKEGEIAFTNPLNTEWVTAGKGMYELKCQSCHRLSEEKLVGPGWKGVTKKRQPLWIMNMITNVEMMLETDPEAQKLLELCLVRMPNQNITKEESRKLIEFMRSNDGEK
jgi:Cytochrome c